MLTSKVRRLTASLALLMGVLLQAESGAADTGSSAPLVGLVVDAQSDPLEGVVVRLRSQSDGWMIAVSSNARGRYQFPASRVPPGIYTLSIRANGYRLADEQATTLALGDRSRSHPIRLTAVTNRDEIAAQLTSLEWLYSWPGSQADKDALVHNIVNCAFCHSLERIARSRHDAEEFMSVIQRMLTYETDHSSANRMQIVTPAPSLEGLSWYGTDARKIAEYLASVNLSADAKDWPYELQLLPRPSGKATEAVVTVFPIPRENSVIHDLDVDAQGRVWYGNTGWDYLGMFDPQTLQFHEWAAPNFLPGEPSPGTDRILGVQDIQVDPRGQVWVATGGTKLTRFIPETETWQAFDLPVIWRNPFLSPVREGEQLLWATGLAAPPDGHKRHETAYALNITTGKISAGINLFDHMPPPEDPLHDDPLNYCYMMDQDQSGDFLCTAPVPSGIIRGERATGRSTFYPTPTPHAYPRRGYRDDSNRFWFSEFFADRIGVLDLDDNSFTEYPLNIPYISPYLPGPTITAISGRPPRARIIYSVSILRMVRC